MKNERLEQYNQYQEAKKHLKLPLDQRIACEILECIEELPELRDISDEDREMLLEFFADIVREEVRER